MPTPDRADLPSTPRIPGLTVTLQTFGDTPAERDALLPVIADGAIRRWLFDLPPTAESAASIIDLSRAGWKTGECLEFAVVANQSIAPLLYPPGSEFPLAGMVRLRDIDLITRSAKIGWLATPIARGAGCVDEAVLLLLSWARSTLNLAQVEAAIHRENHASLRFATRLGFDFLRDGDNGDRIFGISLT